MENPQADQEFHELTPPSSPESKTQEPETEVVPQMTSDLKNRHVPPPNLSGQLPPKKSKSDPTITVQVQELKQEQEYVDMLKRIIFKPEGLGTANDVQLKQPLNSEEMLDQQKQILRMMLFASSLLVIYAVKQVSINVWRTETSHPDSELVHQIRHEAVQVGLQLQALASTNSPGIVYWLANTMHLWTIELSCLLALASLTITGTLVMARLFIGNHAQHIPYLSSIVFGVAVLTMAPLVIWQMDLLTIKVLRFISALQPYPLSHENFPVQLLVSGPLWVLLCGWLVR